MESIVDRLRSEDREALAGMSAGQRVALALALGARDLEAFRDAQRPPLGAPDAARILERRRQAGRRLSRCLEEIIG
jgi:hypothetical protein